MKIDCKKAFNLMLLYLKKESILLGETLRLDQYLSGSYLNHNAYATSVTVEPYYWFDWVELVESSVKKKPSIINNTDGIFLRNCIVAIWYFIRKKFWNLDKNMLLRDAHLMLVSEYAACENNFQYSNLWLDWQKAKGNSYC